MIIINQPYKHTVGIIYKKGIVVNNTHKTSDSKNRYKSRYCVKCKAVFSWQCNCPNNVKHKNVMDKFHKMSMVSVEKALEEIGLDENI